MGISSQWQDSIQKAMGVAVMLRKLLCFLGLHTQRKDQAPEFIAHYSGGIMGGSTGRVYTQVCYCERNRTIIEWDDHSPTTELNGDGWQFHPAPFD